VPCGELVLPRRGEMFIERDISFSIARFYWLLNSINIALLAESTLISDLGLLV
jgi:hypothetical protein